MGDNEEMPCKAIKAVHREKERFKKGVRYLSTIQQPAKE
jgi:hypothetical protein